MLLFTAKRQKPVLTDCPTIRLQFVTFYPLRIVPPDQTDIFRLATGLLIAVNVAIVSCLEQQLNKVCEL